MSNCILILGESGKGKSHSVKYLNPLETFIFNCADKPLPFSGSKKVYKQLYTGDNPDIRVTSYKNSNISNERNIRVISSKLIEMSLRRLDIKTIIIDDLAYSLLESVFERFEEKGFDKFKIFAKELKDLIDSIKKLRSDLTIILMNHIEYDTDSEGSRKIIFKMPAGRFTKEAIVPEGLFDTVLYAESINSSSNNFYFFRTKNSGNDTCKSPEGMFEFKRIPNDLNYVIASYTAYHNGDKMPEQREVTIENDF